MSQQVVWRAEPLSDRRILLGVTGSIASFKALTITSELVRAGATVDVVMTRSATQLVRPMAFQALTHRPVTDDLWAPNGPMGMDHLALARDAEAFVVAPITAHTIARLATGMADDALTTAALAVRCPIVVAPAMEPRMWQHPATNANVRTLEARGVRFVGPIEGRLASGVVGRGRMIAPTAIVDAIRMDLGRDGPLAGRRVVITAGATREPVDPVRFLTNRSTGRMGEALARAARDHGANVTLILGHADIDAPYGIRTERVGTALEMRDAVMAEVVDEPCDVLVMAAAVADFRPAEPSTSKIKKTDSAAPSSIKLSANDDILVELDAALGGHGHVPLRVGFAAETDDIESSARGKLERKGLDMVVANKVPAAFGDSAPPLMLVDRDGTIEIAAAPKPQLAVRILQHAHRLLGVREGDGSDA